MLDLHHRHLPDFIGAEDAELDSADLGDLGRGVGETGVHGGKSREKLGFWDLGILEAKMRDFCIEFGVFGVKFGDFGAILGGF